MSTIAMPKEMTLGDFVKESSIFQYTKEYFEMLKESFELDLMDTYQEAQEFLIENATDLDDSAKSTLLVESMSYSEETLQIYEEKRKGFFGGIVSIGKAIWTAITTIWRKFVNFLSGNELESTRKELEENQEMVTKLLSIVGKRDKAAEEVAEFNAAEIQRLRSMIENLMAGKMELKDRNEQMRQQIRVLKGRDNVISVPSGVDENTKTIAERANAAMSKVLQVEAPIIFFDGDKWFAEAIDLFKTFTNLPFNTASSERLSQAKTLSAKVNKGKTTMRRHTWNVDDAKDKLKFFEDRKSDWDAQLSALGKASADATGTTAAALGLKNRNDDNKEADEVIGDTEKRDISAPKDPRSKRFTVKVTPATGLHAEVLSLVKDLKSANGELIVLITRFIQDQNAGFTFSKNLLNVVKRAKKSA